MSAPHMPDRLPCWLLWTAPLVLGLAPWPAGPGPCHAAARSAPGPESRPVVGQNQSPAGFLLQREYSLTEWRPLKPQDHVYAGDQLMALPGTRADLDIKKGAGRLTLWGSTPELSPVPVLESSVQVYGGTDVDLECQLSRGRVVVTRLREKDPVRVRVGFPGQAYTLSLLDQGAEVAVELIRRWPAGYPFTPQPGPGDVPTASLAVIVLKGQVGLQAGGTEYTLKAPPGPAAFHWNNVEGQDTTPQRREKLPAWAQKEAQESAAAKAVQAAAERQARLMTEQPVSAALTREREGDDASSRRLAIYGLAAIDDLPQVVDALGDLRHADAREAAIVALQNWIGRGTGQDLDLYQFLIQNRGYTDAQAQIVLQLLHGFSNEDRGRSETWDTLIAYLNSPKPRIRVLAAWYLYQWAPEEGKKIPYDPAASEKERDKAYQAWKKLLASGKLPPAAGG